MRENGVGAGEFVEVYWPSSEKTFRTPAGSHLAWKLACQKLLLPWLTSGKGNAGVADGMLDK